MKVEEFNYEKNSNTITDEERNAFIDRFKRACRARGMSVAYLQGILGKANAYFRNMGYISPKMAVEVKKYIPDLNIEYINKGVGSMFLTEQEVKDEQADIEKKNTVPLLPIYANGGSLDNFEDAVYPYECESVVSPVKDADFAITIHGNSMEPEFPSGCIVFIKKINEKAFIEWGKTYVLDTCNGSVIKKIFQSDTDKNKIICRSINREYPDFEVDGADINGFYRILLQMTMK